MNRNVAKSKSKRLVRVKGELSVINFDLRAKDDVAEPQSSNLFFSYPIIVQEF